MFAGWASSSTLLGEIAQTARDLPPTGDPPHSAANLLLQGYTARLTDGYAAAVPVLRRAVQAFLAEDVDPDIALRRLLLAAITAADLLDDASVERLTTSWINRARERGALAKLAAALAFRSAPSGHRKDTRLLPAGTSAGAAGRWRNRSDTGGCRGPVPCRIPGFPSPPTQPGRRPAGSAGRRVPEGSASAGSTRRPGGCGISWMSSWSPPPLTVDAIQTATGKPREEP